ncbi:MAG: (2Fe-2S)-binding protein, partial [Deltaproteobacteria bacterium]|nr:(2Fe-2S)-binding protein [Deltaproteobacteria bacterium]
MSTTENPVGTPPAPSGGLPATPPAPPAPAPAANTVTLTIDGESVTVPKGTNVLEAARTLG